MFLRYNPEDGEPREWMYKPAKLMCDEAEALEKCTQWTLEEFTMNLQRGSTLARRALLWVFLRRDHASLRVENVKFRVGEVEVQMDRAELAAMRSQIEQIDFSDQTVRNAALQQIDDQILTAPEDPTLAPKAESSTIA